MEAVYHPAFNKQMKLPPTMSLLRAKLLLMLLFSYTDQCFCWEENCCSAALLPLIAVTAVSCWCCCCCYCCLLMFAADVACCCCCCFCYLLLQCCLQLHVAAAVACCCYIFNCCKLLAILAVTFIVLLDQSFCKLKAAGRLKLLQTENILKLPLAAKICKTAAPARQQLLLLQAGCYSYLHDYFMLLPAENCKNVVAALRCQLLRC